MTNFIDLRDGPDYGDDPKPQSKANKTGGWTWCIFYLDIGKMVMLELGPACFAIWICCLDKFRRAKEKPFPLNNNLTNEWGISKSRMGGHLKKLQDSGFLRFTQRTGKSPRIEWVRESLDTSGSNT